MTVEEIEFPKDLDGYDGYEGYERGFGDGISISSEALANKDKRIAAFLKQITNLERELNND